MPRILEDRHGGSLPLFTTVSYRFLPLMGLATETFARATSFLADLLEGLGEYDLAIYANVPLSSQLTSLSPKESGAIERSPARRKVPLRV